MTISDGPRRDEAPSASPADADLPDELNALRAAEAAAVRTRRERVLGPAAAGNAAELNLPTVGLALSGGGVRSATFALGLMRGLARRQTQSGATPDPARQTLSASGLLGRLDYLSTVSGGGYTGGMYGRLVATYGIECAQSLMARASSPVLDWLRRNGRYLTPSGSRDIGIAVVTYFRSWLAIHVEFMVACMLLGLIVTGPHLWNHSFQVLDGKVWSRWQTPWWAIAAAWCCVSAPGLMTGYWAARDNAASMSAAVRRGPGWRDAAVLLGLAAGAWALIDSTYSGGVASLAVRGLSWSTAASLILVSVVAGQAGVMVWVQFSAEPHTLKVARLRNWLTRALRLAVMATVGLAGLGVLDRLSWWFLLQSQQEGTWLWNGLGAGGVLVVVLRAMAQPLQQIAARSDQRAREWLPRFIDAASLLGLLILVTAWLVVMQWFVFSPATLSGFANVPPLLRAALVAIIWLVWVVLTAGNSQMANTSSLHSFYRARLNRAYLAVGNRQRSMDQDAGSRADVTRVVEGDDTSLRHYRPETEGGPIHLINTCLNQTRDDMSGLYNADRKGTAVTATWRGFELGPRDFIAFKPDMDVGTLGRWVAVSGAAASPGAGAYTSRGLALLVYFLGVRLGHWMRAPCKRVQLRWLSRLGWRLLPKPLMLASEASATFFGTERPWWYLSDGGHFENSGVYALLKREVGFIIASDASSDARYEFNDLENLVRKARIDFGAEIDFYTADEAKALFCLGSNELTVLSPEDMVDNHSCRGVLLARIRYRERPGGPGGRPYRPEGTLLVIKPNLHDALDVDLLGYARKHEAFPHEPSGDQSFDEAQWESYHRLGEDFGGALHESWLAQVPGWRSPAHHALRVAARLSSAQKAAGDQRLSPLWQRRVRAAAIGTTLGVGASGTLLLSLWQVQDQFQQEKNDSQLEARKIFGDVSAGLKALDAACPDASEQLITQMSLLLEVAESPALRPAEKEGAERIKQRLTQECLAPSASMAGCSAPAERSREVVCSVVMKRELKDPFDYWEPLVNPKAQCNQAMETLNHVSTWFPVVAGLCTRLFPHMRTESDYYSAAWGGSVPAMPAPSPVPSPAPTAGATPQPRPGVPTGALRACARAADSTGNPRRTILYVQVYDEASRASANELRRKLQTMGGSYIQVAPLENVTRSADLRQQRRPAPWPKPTLILHDIESRPCARAIASTIGAPWLSSATPGDTDRVWLRDLPSTLKPQVGAIELWLPPLEVNVSQNSLPAGQIVVGLDMNR